MNYAFAVEFQELSQGSPTLPAYHGQATLSRWRLSDSRLLRFRHQSNFWDPQWYTPNLSFMERRRGGRMALVTHVCLAESTLAVYNLHLESRNGNDLRNRQLAEVLQDARHYDHGVLVVAGGDFNVDVSLQRENWAIRNAGFDNPFANEKAPTTVPSLLGRQKSLDSILTRGKVTILAAEIHRGVNASDHYPLSLTVRLDDVVEKKS